MARRKHVTEGREDAIERPVLEGELLGVTLDPLELETLALGLGTPLFQQLRRQVETGHAPACPSGGHGGVARAAGHVEDALTRLQRSQRHERVLRGLELRGP